MKTISKFEATSAAKAAPLSRGQLAPVPLAKPEAPRGAPVVIGGRLGHVGDRKPKRARRLKSYRIDLPLQIVEAVVRLPAVAGEIELGRRLYVLKLADALVPHVISGRQFCRAIGLSPSRLTEWRTAYATGGAKALRPRPWAGGRHPKQGSRRQGPAFLDLILKPASH